MIRVERTIAPAWVAGFFMIAFCAGCGCPKAPANPEITITNPPPRGAGGRVEMDMITGAVSGVNPNDVKVLIYAHAGDRWWVQPLVDYPFTPVGNDRQWRAKIHLGDEYAALLVNKDYRLPSSQSQPLGLPAVGDCIWAVATRAGR